MIRALHRKLLVVVVLALLAAACSSDGGEGGTGDSAQPAPRQELTVGVTQDQYTTDGPQASLGVAGPNANIYETLLYMGPNFEIRPMLAERWEFRAPNTFRFFLRRGVKFHDGQPLNAQAVKVGVFDRAATAGGLTLKAGPESTVVVDEYTLDFTPKIPNLRLFEQIVHASYPVIAPNSEVGKKPVGTGPFRFVEYVAKERIVVERNPDYWGTRAILDKLSFRFYPDSSARRLALEAGEIDVAFDVPRADVKSLKATGVNVPTSPVGGYQVLFADLTGKAPYDLLADVNLRKAVAHAIDRRALISGVLDGLATPDQSMVPSPALGPHAGLVKGIQFDLAQSRRILDDAGWKVGSGGIREKDGRQLKLVLVSGFPSAEVLRPIPAFVQAQLKAVGFDVTIDERPDSASFRDRIRLKEGDLFLEQRSQNDADPSFLPVVFMSDISEGGAAPYQAAFNPGQPFNGLLRSTLTEANIDKVQASVAQAMRNAVDEQATVIGLAGVYPIYGIRSNVQAFVAHPTTQNVLFGTVRIGKA
ncbi:MAG: ABC transporter substrate-binding protein [Actinomycetota bacterium]|nr:ABC transporter substrate-binding protein [Actinomycetota bacterium]